MIPEGAPSLENLRIFAAVVDEGGFSAAARQLEKSQPAVSYSVANLEGQLGLTLFERGKRKPVLTPAGHAILAYARRLSQLSDELVASAASLTVGLEGFLTVVVDSFFPTAPLTAALADLAETYPSVSLDLQLRSREIVLDRVVQGQANIGVGALDVAWPSGVEARDFSEAEFYGVAAPSHLLAQYSGRIPTMVLRNNLQITNRSAMKGGEARDASINSSCIWHVNNPTAQVDLLRQGLGWGYLPAHLADPEIAAGTLVRLDTLTRRGGFQPWSLIYRATKPPGQAARFLADRLEFHSTNKIS